MEAPVVSGQQKIQDRHPLGKSCWPSFGMSVALYCAVQEKGPTMTSARYGDMLVDELKPAIRSKRREKCIGASRQRPPSYGCAYSGYTTSSEIWGKETSTTHSGLGATGLSLVWTFERIFAGPEVCRWRGNEGGSKLVEGHAKKLFSRRYPQTCGQVYEACCEAGGLCQKIGQFL